MARCGLGLGGNLGDVAATFRTALQQLRDSGHAIVAVSSLYSTAPVGPQSGDAYHNACVLIDTLLPPHALLKAVQEIENAAGRTRSVRWGARSLDVDILTYDDLVLTEPELMLPHPGVVYRRFVLDPLAEIAPQLVHPRVNRTIAELQQRLRLRPLPIGIVTGDHALDLRITAHLRERFADTLTVEHDTARAAASDATFLVREQAAGLDGNICVALDRQIAAVDPLAAAVAAVTAMLDEPSVVGTL